MEGSEITARQTAFYLRESELGKLIPRVDTVVISEEQSAVQAKVALLQKQHYADIAFFGELLDTELWPARNALEKVYVDALAGLPDTSHADLPEACKALAKVNGKRIELYQELRRCARIAGRPKVPYPLHVGVRDNEITDASKIQNAFLGFGEPVARGRGQITTFGGTQ